jgi:hypothetical protein
MIISMKLIFSSYLLPIKSSLNLTIGQYMTNELSKNEKRKTWTVTPYNSNNDSDGVGIRFRSLVQGSTSGYFQKSKNSFVAKTSKILMSFMLLSKSKLTIFEKKISINAMNSGSKEWISALVYKDITSNKYSKSVLNWANSIANLKTFRMTHVK